MDLKNILKQHILLLLILFICSSSFAQNNEAEMYYQRAEELRKNSSINNQALLIIENYAKAATMNHTQALIECARFFIKPHKYYRHEKEGRRYWKYWNYAGEKIGKKYWKEYKHGYDIHLAQDLLKKAADLGDNMACFIIGIDNMVIPLSNNVKRPINMGPFGFTNQTCAFYLNKAIANGYKPALLAQQCAEKEITELSSELVFNVMKIAEDTPQVAYMLACMYRSNNEGKSLYWFNVAFERFKDWEDLDLMLSTTTPIAPEYPTNLQKAPTFTAISDIDDVDINIPTTNKKSVNTYVLIIANENYDDVKNVDYALSDGRVFREYCIKTLGIPTENIQLREDATLNKMIAGIDWLTDICSATNGKANVIVYYSGHGFPNEATQDSYLLPVDGSGKNTRTGLSLNELYSTLAQVKSQSVSVFLDACFSGATRGNDMLVAARGVAIKAKSGSPQGNMTVFCAAQGNETAYPYEQAKHGMFTYYLLKKLKDCKGDVTLGELSDYIQSEVSKQSVLINGKSQTPNVSVSSSMNQEWRNKKMLFGNK